MEIPHIHMLKKTFILTENPKSYISLLSYNKSISTILNTFGLG